MALTTQSQLDVKRKIERQPRGSTEASKRAHSTNPAKPVLEPVQSTSHPPDVDKQFVHHLSLSD